MLDCLNAAAFIKLSLSMTLAPGELLTISDWARR